MGEGCIHKEGSQSGGKTEDAGVIMQLKVKLGNVHAHTPHLLKTRFVNSLINVERTPYMLEVKQINNYLLDDVPSQSCENTTSDKFLLLDTKTKRKEKSFTHPLYCQKKETKQKLGTNVASPMKHICNSLHISPLKSHRDFATGLVATLGCPFPTPPHTGVLPFFLL